MERDQIDEFVRAVIRSYRRTLPSDRRHLLEDFHLADVARKVVGVGSVGTRAWIVLMLGRDDTDPLFLQAKEAEASVLEEFVGRSDRRSHGERVVHGQHLMQASSDIFLGWDHVQGVDGVERDYYVRQLRDWKGAAVVETMNPATMALYARVVCRRAGPGPRPLRRPHRHRLLPGLQRRLRPGHRRVLRGLRRPERARLHRPRPSRKGRPHHRPTRHLTRPRHRPRWHWTEESRRRWRRRSPGSRTGCYCLRFRPESIASTSPSPRYQASTATGGSAARRSRRRSRSGLGSVRSSTSPRSGPTEVSTSGSLDPAANRNPDSLRECLLEVFAKLTR